jgi:multidrug resistance efflux pump
MATLTKKTALPLFAVAAAAIAIVAGTCALLPSQRQLSSNASADDPPAAAAASSDDDVNPDLLQVKVIKPRRDPAFTMTVSEPAYVEAYYKAPLKAKVSGPVKFVKKDIGARVKKDEVLAVIDVPDLIEAVKQANKVIDQRKRDEELAQTKVEVARAEIAVAQSTVAMKQKLLGAANAIRDFRYKLWKHYEGLASEKGVSGVLVEEQEKNYLGAYADCEAADEAVTQAKAKLAEAEQNLQVAKADVAFKHSLVEVAGADRDKAQAMADYTEIRAPFDGVIVKRNVDPGSFVDIGTASSDPLFIVERMDIVTVYMKVPDSFAPYVTDGTQATITIPTLPGVKFRGVVTRHEPSLESSHTDLTMRVEVDLFNGSQHDYLAWMAAEKTKPVPFDDLRVDDAGRPVKPWPPVVEISNPNAPPAHLLPDMYGTMELVLQTFKDTYLVPSDALVQQGGEHYLYLYKDGKAQKVLVVLQADDGKLAKVAKILKKGDQQLLEEPTGNDQVIYSSLSDLSDGQAVTPIPVSW